MIIEQCRWTTEHGWTNPPEGGTDIDLVFLFGGRSVLQTRSILDELRSVYPGACLFGCSTAGEILDTQVTDDTLVTTAVSFDRSRCCCVSIHIGETGSSLEAGQDLAGLLEHEGLVHVFVLSDGIRVNGSDLLRGLAGRLPTGVSVTGGLAGDSDRFEETFVICDEVVSRGTIGAIGFYGKALHVGFGSLGGWDPFGPERLITRSTGNVLFEMDGVSALDLYKRYLGNHASELPASAMLFPLSIRRPGDSTGLVRTILAVDEDKCSMTFAGDVPEGAYAQLMEANFDRLIDGAIGAAKESVDGLGGADAELALLISCVGRKMVLRQRVEEELEGVREILGPGAILTGFYSYGEICPVKEGFNAELHNQTMTITTLSES